MHLLTYDNPKTVKGNSQGYVTAILHLAPANLSGYNVCPMATAGCIAACLNTAGRGGIAKGGHLRQSDIAKGKVNAIQRARIARTKYYFENRQGFLMQLDAEITLFKIKAINAGMKPCVRLNGTSDIPWHIIAKDIMEKHYDIQFYDYTKVLKRMYEALPSNYHLTYSCGENTTLGQIDGLLSKGFNVAVVFGAKPKPINGKAWAKPKALPKTWHSFPVVNGDATDLRFMDGQGVIVGLTAKGQALNDVSGFVKAA